MSTPIRLDWVSQNELPIAFTPGALETQSGEYHTHGNPGLTPVKSKNIDLSAEWYYTRQSMVSLGLYHKDLSGYAGQITLVEASPTATTPIGGKYFNAAVASGCARTDTDCLRDYILSNYAGQPGVVPGPPTGSDHLGGTITGIPGDPGLPYNVSTIVNQDNATLKGAEIDWPHMFDNGFGVQANYTYVKSDLTYDNTSLATSSPWSASTRTGTGRYASPTTGATSSCPPSPRTGSRIRATSNPTARSTCRSGTTSTGT